MIKWQDMMYEDGYSVKAPFAEVFALKVSGINNEYGEMFRIYPAQIICAKGYSGDHLIHSGIIMRLFGRDDCFEDSNNDCDYAIKWQDGKTDLVTHIKNMGSRYQWCPWDEFVNGVAIDNPVAIKK